MTYTMQIASQVYGIETAANALIFFKNSTQAYIIKWLYVEVSSTLFTLLTKNSGISEKIFGEILSLMLSK